MPLTWSKRRNRCSDPILDRNVLNESSDSLKADARNFLLEEYRALSTAMVHNEAVGETRVNWFIGLVTAVGGGLAALAKTGYAEPLMISGSLAALLLFGVVTLARLMKRNRTTDGFKKDLGDIRQRFKHHFDPAHVLVGHKPFGARAHRAFRGFGGLTHTIVTINSLLAAGVAAGLGVAAHRWCLEESRCLWENSFLWASAHPLAGVLPWASAFAAFAVAVVVQETWVWLEEKRTKVELGATPYTHAGGVVFRSATETEYLLVRPSKRQGDEWVLPKGHIKKHETSAEAARREVAEETGVTAGIVQPLGVISFVANQERVHALFFLMEFLEEDKARKEKPGREHRWFALDAALHQSIHPQTKELLQLADQSLRGRPQVLYGYAGVWC
jgi:ADP-ribose pyrophosphatase YjhB (NUDIX family)